MKLKKILITVIGLALLISCTSTGRVDVEKVKKKSYAGKTVNTFMKSFPKEIKVTVLQEPPLVISGFSFNYHNYRISIFVEEKVTLKADELNEELKKLESYSLDYFNDKTIARVEYDNIKQLRDELNNIAGAIDFFNDLDCDSYEGGSLKLLVNKIPVNFDNINLIKESNNKTIGCVLTYNVDSILEVYFTAPLELKTNYKVEKDVIKKIENTQILSLNRYSFTEYVEKVKSRLNKNALDRYIGKKVIDCLMGLEYSVDDVVPLNSLTLRLDSCMVKVSNIVIELQFNEVEQVDNQEQWGKITERNILGKTIASIKVYEYDSFLKQLYERL